MKKILFLTFLFLSCSVFADSSQVTFSGGWIKQLPPVVPMRAGYLTIENNGDSNAEITAIQSESFERVEMHETMMVDGMMKMVEQESIVVPAHGKTELKPGGKHLMLITPLTDLQIGDTVNLTVSFSDEQSQQVQLVVKQ
jgi:copper(I)-binding protein